MKNVDFTIFDENAVEILEDDNGLYFMIEKYKARLLCHSKAKSLISQDVLNFIVDHLDDLI